MLGLATGIVAGLPLIAGAALAGGARFETGSSVVLVRRRISFGELAIPKRRSVSEPDKTPMTAHVSGFQELADWLNMKVAGYLGVPSDTIDIDTPLADCGIDSVLAIGIV